MASISALNYESWVLTLESLSDLLTSATFWTVVGAVAAVVALIPLAHRAVRKWRKRSLTNFLRQERAFYSDHAAKRDRKLAQRYREIADRYPNEDMGEHDRTLRYLQDVRKGVKGLEELPRAEVDKAKEDLRQLIEQLRATHETLVDALQLFGAQDAERFFKEFDRFKTKFQSVYSNGQILGARTRSHQVQDLVFRLTDEIDSSVTGWDEVREFGVSVVVLDREVIVPVMISVLERASVELDLISDAIDMGDKRRAISLKERYWFDAEPLHDEVKDTLARMNELVSRL